MTERTRTCRQCQYPYPIEGIYFRPLPGKDNGFDTVCMVCRDAGNERTWNIQQGQKPDSVPEGFPEDELRTFG